MFPMTVTINNQTQFNAVMALFQNADTEPVINAVPAMSASDKTTPKKEEIKKDSPAAAALTTTEAPAILLDNKQPTYTFEEAAHEITELATTKGTDTARAVLKQFGVNKLTEIKLENYAPVIEAIMAVKG